jgi:hypothetical protein
MPPELQNSKSENSIRTDWTQETGFVKIKLSEKVGDINNVTV